MDKTAILVNRKKEICNINLTKKRQETDMQALRKWRRARQAWIKNAQKHNV